MNLIEPLPLETIAQTLRDQQGFCYARYGLDDWGCILGMIDNFNQEQQFTDDLRFGLQQTLLRHQPYAKSCSMEARQVYGMEIHVYLEFIERIRPHALPWLSSDSMRDASEAGTLAPLVEALRTRRILYVGPAYLEALESKLFPVVKLLSIPEENAWSEHDMIFSTLANAITPWGDTMIGLSCGPMAKWLVWKLYERFGESVTVVDFGSLWDGYLGVRSRHYMTNPLWIEKATQTLQSLASEKKP